MSCFEINYGYVMPMIALSRTTPMKTVDGCATLLHSADDLILLSFKPCHSTKLDSVLECKRDLGAIVFLCLSHKPKVLTCVSCLQATFMGAVLDSHVRRKSLFVALESHCLLR